jgi:hypothetical protein
VFLVPLLLVPLISATAGSIRRYLTNADCSADPTFCGSLDFLDHQPLLNAIFPRLNCKPIGSLQHFSTPNAAPDFLNFAGLSIQAFLAKCHLTFFQTVICLDYVARHNFASTDHLHMTVKCLHSLTLEFSVHRKMIHGNLDMIFSQYLSLTPLLPTSHVNVWGIKLCTQFWTALGEDLTHCIIHLPCYLAIHDTAFDLTMMTTKDHQIAALCELRSLAVESFYALQDCLSMRAMFHKLSPLGYTSSHLLDSAAKAAMQRYLDPPASPAIQTYRQIPLPMPHLPSQSPGFPIGDFPAKFHDCLGCGGGPDHIFCSCPMKHHHATID